ncbi:hypothetical protein L207DRAFT_183600 [Hyaloscypha variabilis F]|uniref:Uncharacterized protein n=1 Tax=Hyaloscypha variabilis (strain UAMH 11265 / GT02V1 / F) TaxID=1149755 RepID=A0A2J6R0N5_HYAVF|nr:hypothetical protein L207DRAFT_183600 [Hyaloscypha variabilis F]
MPNETQEPRLNATLGGDVPDEPALATTLQGSFDSDITTVNEFTGDTQEIFFAAPHDVPQADAQLEMTHHLNSRAQEQKLSEPQQLRLEILRENFEEVHGKATDLVQFILSQTDRHLKYPHWTAFTLLYPTVAFKIEEIVDQIREADKIFVDHAEREYWAVESPLLYLIHDEWVDTWREGFDSLFNAGPYSSLWGQHIYDVKKIVKALDGDGTTLLEELDVSLRDVDHRLARELEASINPIRVRVKLLQNRNVKIKKLEEQRKKKSEGEIRRQKHVLCCILLN